MDKTAEWARPRRQQLIFSEEAEGHLRGEAPSLNPLLIFINPKHNLPLTLSPDVLFNEENPLRQLPQGPRPLATPVGRHSKDGDY